MWIKQATTKLTPEAGTRNERIGVIEGMPRNQLFLDRAAASFAAELSVESIKGPLFGSELVLIAF